MKASALLGIILLLCGCGETAPPCQNAAQSPVAPSAGCLVVTDRGVLLVRDWTGSVALPGGSVQPGESAHCGAEREVFEETGLMVVAGDVAQRFKNGFQLFWCEVAVTAEPTLHRPFEIRQIMWWQPAEAQFIEWRYPRQGDEIKTLIAGRRAAPGFLVESDRQ
ncbi:MAG: NUDIX hydrolase [Halieaceae bacterium]|nr:NUDIX hydrolase [Halieaceae bacterium]